MLLERGSTMAARASMAAAKDLVNELSERESSHIAAFDLHIAGEPELPYRHWAPTYTPGRATPWFSAPRPSLSCPAGPIEAIISPSTSR
jgi:hypothetical protein